jgi:hypothetical protein
MQLGYGIPVAGVHRTLRVRLADNEVSPGDRFEGLVIIKRLSLKEEVKDSNPPARRQQSRARDDIKSCNFWGAASRVGL